MVTGLPVVILHNASAPMAPHKANIIHAVTNTTAPSPAIVIPLAVVLVIAIAAIVVYMLRTASRKFSYMAAIYDPRTRMWRLYRVAKVATNVYSTIDGKMIIIGSPNSELEDTSGKTWPTLTAIDTGGINMSSDLYSNLIVSMLGEEYSTKTPAEIIAKLYEIGEVPASIKIRPDMHIAVTVDGNALAKQLSYEKARRESETMLAIAAMGYNRKEFEEIVRHMIEKELSSAKSFSMKAMAAAIAIMFILAVILNFVVHK